MTPTYRRRYINAERRASKTMLYTYGTETSLSPWLRDDRRYGNGQAVALTTDAIVMATVYRIDLITNDNCKSYTNYTWVGVLFLVSRTNRCCVYKTINLSFGLVKTTVWTVSSVASYTILLGCAQGLLAVSAILALYRVFGLRAPPSICFWGDRYKF